MRILTALWTAAVLTSVALPALAQNSGITNQGAITRLRPATDIPACPAAGWQGSGVVEDQNGIIPQVHGKYRSLYFLLQQ